MQTLVRFVILFGLLGNPVAAFAQTELSEDDLTNMLQNSRDDGQSELTTNDLEQLQQNKIVIHEATEAREVTVKMRRKLARIVDQGTAASVNLEILFEHGSDRLTGGAYPSLIRLGRALTSGKLQTSVFMLAGHTDASGSSGYNQRLSQKRAKAVRQFLMDSFDIKRTRLIAVGYGEERLKIPTDPEAGANRRVQIVNMTQ